MNEESDVIRIYRRGSLPAPMRRAEGGKRSYDRMAVTGIVEDVECAEQRAFHGIDELRGIISGSKCSNKDAENRN